MVQLPDHPAFQGRTASRFSEQAPNLKIQNQFVGQIEPGRWTQLLGSLVDNLRAWVSLLGLPIHLLS